MRIYRLITATKRLGQAHEIDRLLGNRPPGNLMVYCPSCPELGLNTEVGWERTPPELR